MTVDRVFYIFDIFNYWMYAGTLYELIYAPDYEKMCMDVDFWTFDQRVSLRNIIGILTFYNEWFLRNIYTPFIHIYTLDFNSIYTGEPYIYIYVKF